MHPPPDRVPSIRRVLFLDDDPMRAAEFLESAPWAVWVQTAEDCLARLSEPWDEVHLDHDLGGEQFVDSGREDCGMAVVRWLCEGESPREHLRSTRFVVHTHNPFAACSMTLHLQVTGYDVREARFGERRPVEGRGLGLVSRLGRWLRRASGM